MEQRYLCFTLFNRRGGLVGRSIDGIDRELLLDAVRAGLSNDDGRARGTLGSIYQQLSLEEIKPLLPAILEAVIKPAPSGVMFASEIRTEGLRIMAKHYVEEGIQACVTYCQTQNPWASEERVPQIMNILVSYGAHGQRVIPQLEALAADYAEGEPDFPRRLSGEKAASVRDAIEKIKASNNKPRLIRIGQEEEAPAHRSK